ncbi:hypothetical protein F5X99DRAFT_427614 [Biscogniauxia marginata]|nr:hypothetical protein F5X99DRAFT_427614 [Biscogniauxia marginata]
MASAAPQTSASVDELRQPLMNLTINPKPRGAQHRISKPGPTNPARTRRVRPRATQSRERSLQLSPEQRDRAIATFNALQCRRRFAKRTPRVSRQYHDDMSCGRIGLEYPRYRLWRLLGDRTLPTLKRRDVQCLRQTLIQDISQLYALHLPYIPDLTKLEVMAKAVRGTIWDTYWPLLDTFDFDIDVNDPDVPWMELRDTRIRIVEAQFDVLEQLAVLSQSPHHQRVTADLQPDVVAQVLRQHTPPEQQCIAIIRLVNTYSTELGQFMIESARKHLCRLAWRNESVPLTQVATLGYSCTTNHVLGLLDQSTQDSPFKDDTLLLDRAALLVVYATLLVQLHAKTIKVLASHGLLENSSNDTADSYTTYEHFASVVQASNAAEEAIRELAEKGIKLDDEIMIFVRADA